MPKAAKHCSPSMQWRASTANEHKIRTGIRRHHRALTISDMHSVTVVTRSLFANNWNDEWGQSVFTVAWFGYLSSSSFPSVYPERGKITLKRKVVMRILGFRSAATRPRCIFSATPQCPLARATPKHFRVFSFHFPLLGRRTGVTAPSRASKRHSRRCPVQERLMTSK